MKRSLSFMAVSVLAVIVAGVLSAVAADMEQRDVTGLTEDDILYPAIEPLRSGWLKVSDIHGLYWEVSGNEDGIPVFYLHGGPGGMAGPRARRYFDPKKFKIILFDQRGAGRSKPLADVRENTTADLVEDINLLRQHLGVTKPAILLGGSWGSTLAVAYAEAYPENVAGLVLRGVFLGSKFEIDRFYHGGTSDLFPENFERLQRLIPNPDSLDYPRQLYEMTQSEDPEIRKKAIDGWAWYETRIASLTMTDEQCDYIIEKYDMTSFSVIENFYMMNGCFVDDDQLLREAGKIADIPTFIVNGRYDVVCSPITAYRLAGKLKNVKLEFTLAGHLESDLPNTEGLVRGTEWVASQIAK